MRITVERLQRDVDVTIGSMSVDGAWQCWTLEDTVREKQGVPVAQWKIPGETAIPVGLYRVTIDMSNRFGRLLPLLINVPGFAGVRIHPGNTAANTEGCILVGRDRLPKSIGASRIAFDRLFAKMSEAQRRGEAIELEVF